MFPTPDTAVEAAAALHGLGVSREAISVVARTHERQGVYARVMDATPGAEFEDSRSAGRLGELGAVVIAAVASVMPGGGTLVAAGPLSAELGEAAGHLAGNLTGVLERAGVDASRAVAWQHAVEGGRRAARGPCRRGSRSPGRETHWLPPARRPCRSPGGTATCPRDGSGACVVLVVRRCGSIRGRQNHRDRGDVSAKQSVSDPGWRGIGFAVESELCLVQNGRERRLALKDRPIHVRAPVPSNILPSGYTTLHLLHADSDATAFRQPQEPLWRRPGHIGRHPRALPDRLLRPGHSADTACRRNARASVRSRISSSGST